MFSWRREKRRKKVKEKKSVLSYKTHVIIK
jgi:hypothetical protein